MEAALALPIGSGIPSSTQFQPTRETEKKDNTIVHTTFHSITRSPAYQNFSFEELRYEFLKSGGNHLSSVQQQQQQQQSFSILQQQPQQQQPQQQSSFSITPIQTQGLSFGDPSQQQQQSSFSFGQQPSSSFQLPSLSFPAQQQQPQAQQQPFSFQPFQQPQQQQPQQQQPQQQSFAIPSFQQPISVQQPITTTTIQTPSIVQQQQQQQQPLSQQQTPRLRPEFVAKQLVRAKKSKKPVRPELSGVSPMIIHFFEEQEEHKFIAEDEQQQFTCLNDFTTLQPVEEEEAPLLPTRTDTNQSQIHRVTTTTPARSPISFNKSQLFMMTPLSQQSPHHSDSPKTPSPLNRAPTFEQQISYASLAPRLTKDQYYTIPSLCELQEMTAAERSSISNFIIGRRSVGLIQWEGVTNVNGLDIDSLVHIEPRYVEVYPEPMFNQSNKPPLGKQLNKPALVTLFGVLPTSSGNNNFVNVLQKVLQKRCTVCGLYT